MKSAFFSQDGSLLCLTDADVVGGVPVPASFDPNSVFFDGQHVVERSVVVPSLDRPLIVSDGVEAATISGLPDPCVLIVNGASFAVSGGSYTVTADVSSRIVIELGGAHRSERIVVRADTAETLMGEVRAERDARLTASDWTQGRDTPLNDDQITAWAGYRQALRDLPAQQPAANIETVAWPIAPSE